MNGGNSDQSRLNRTTSRSTTASGGTLSSSHSDKSSENGLLVPPLPDVVRREGKKWVYDKVLDRYVPLDRTPYIASKLAYFHCLSKISSMASHELNFQLNRSVVQNLTNLELLRYSYFEGFEYEGSKVVIDGAVSRIGPATTSSTVQEDEEVASGGAALGSDTIHNKHSKSHNMRSLLESDQFWNTCYQDLKFESMVEGSDVYDKLPPLQSTMRFYVELIDYILLHLHILKPSLEKIKKSSEYDRLAKQYQLYFNNCHFSRLCQIQSGFKGIEVNNKLILTIITNFEAVKKLYQLDSHLVSIWTRFLTFVGKIIAYLSKVSPTSFPPTPPSTPQLQRHDQELGFEFSTQQPNPPFARKTSLQQQQQQPRQASVASQSSSVMSHAGNREGSVWTMDTMASSSDETESVNDNLSSFSQLSPLSEISTNSINLQATPSNESSASYGAESGSMGKPKKKISFFGKLRGK
ncbi:hypothetical protein KGF57_001613 [Candida theae]|uniref:Uncharacterized protein n=1 Tax=Candida theae TaxID=1198502 RepID=A0AAD5BGR2_9ASCO|nr:uncharacterized protein KGF57_001613 [Candida theae]KAI5961679.1 hypothetical protein KGF57_001613 [Candida theae]